jgi:hypothetical protein
MSRTDKTDPWPIKGRWHARERHNHAKGYCDLPPLHSGATWRETTACHWEADLNQGYMHCPCPICHGWDGKPVSRRHRYSARREIHDQLHD